MAATAWRSLTAFGMTFLGNGAWDRGHGSVVRRNGSADAEFRLAAIEKRARAFAHVVGGENQAELRGLVLNCFVQRAIGADVDAVDDAAPRQRRGGGELRGQLHGFGFETGRPHTCVDAAKLL